MARKEQQQTDKSSAEIVDRVWELAKKIDFCMFVTWDGERQQARPLSSRVAREEGAIHFLVSSGSDKIGQIARFPVVNLAYADTGAMKYISIAGTAVVGNDRARIRDLWSPFDKAWWEDAEDPDIRLVTVTPDHAELWDSPNKAVAFVGMLTAAVTGAKPDFGDNATVPL